jgi:hypothetical protein
MSWKKSSGPVTNCHGVPGVQAIKTGQAISGCKTIWCAPKAPLTSKDRWPIWLGDIFFFRDRSQTGLKLFKVVQVDLDEQSKS